MAWMIDGNRLKEKAVSLLFPTEMETCGHLPTPVQAVTVSTIEDMVYREGVEVVRCKDCAFYIYEGVGSSTLKRFGRCAKWYPFGNDQHSCHDDDFCSYGERREGE